MKGQSLRFRLAIWYAAVLIAAMAVSGATLWVTLRHRLYSEVDRDLAGRAGRFQTYISNELAEGLRGEQLKDELDEFCQALPLGSTLRLTGASGFGFHCGAQSSPGAASLREHRNFAVGAESFDLELVAPLDEVNRTLELVGSLLLGLLPIAIVVAVAGGAWLGRKALKPVDDIVRAAMRTGIDDLSQRLPVTETGDELERLTRAWNDSLARLEAAVGTLSRFAADASHELRTPLAVIRTSAEVALRQARSAEAYRESLEEIAEEATRMTRLVEDLLLLSRTEAQAAEMPRARIALGDVLGEAVAEMRGFAQLRDVALVGPGAAAQSAWIKANRAGLKRILLVLIENAIKYSPAGSEVLVSAESGNGRVVAAIADHGTGIAPGDRERIFERFYQADPSRRDGGFGLGLSLAQSIARAHGTLISVESEEGVGSTFRVAFPVLHEAKEPLETSVGA